MSNFTMGKTTFNEEVGLNDSDLSLLATKLRQEVLEKQDYLQRIATSSSNNLPEKHPDPIDKAANQSLHTLNSALIKKDIERIEKINRALSRIADGTFGICEDCGDSIDIKRLEARPEASRCISCAEEVELKKMN